MKIENKKLFLGEILHAELLYYVDRVEDAVSPNRNNANRYRSKQVIKHIMYTDVYI